MTTKKGVGRFNAQNIVAFIRAFPESNGTYAHVAEVTAEYGGDINAHTIAHWVQLGPFDIRAAANRQR